MRPIRRATGLAPAAGIGLKPHHVRDILASLPDLGFLEIHAENYMGAGGPPHAWLERLCSHYQLSVHGVGLSIGGSGPLDKEHLARLKALLARYQPESFSEHLAWSTHEGVYLSDLLPLPYDRRTLERVCDHIDEVQMTLGRRMLLENPSTYVAFEQSDRAEVDFLADVVAHTGCGLLLDVNNVYVSARNNAYDAVAYLDAFPYQHVGEIHLAGYAEDSDEVGMPLLIDAHDSPVADPVWRLYARVLARTGPVATLIEWDSQVPPLPELLAEARRAERFLRQAALREVEGVPV
jgi:uncharacterized protein